MTSSILVRAAVPIATALVLAAHPTDPDHAVELAAVAPRWVAVHLGLLIALPAAALVIRDLLRGVPGRAARLADALLLPAVAAYAAFETLLGTGTGILVQLADELPVAERAGALAAAEAWWQVPTVVSLISVAALATWTTAVVTAGVALHRDGGQRTAGLALIASAVAFLAGHPGATGVLAMLALLTAVLSTALGEPSEPAEQSARQGGR